MNYLVFLNAQAGELEKILSGVKSMILMEWDLAQTASRLVEPGDSLYFLRHKGDCDLRVKATVLQVQSYTTQKGEDLSHVLKEMQPKLQLTEEQYNGCSVKTEIILVEFGFAQKIDLVHLAQGKIPDRSNWIAFEELCQITGRIASD